MSCERPNIMPGFGLTTPENDESGCSDRAIQMPEAGLYIVSTPIGNLRDITLRALDTLKAVDQILVEDTRIARHLLAKYAIKARLGLYHDHNGARQRPQIVRKIENGAAIALISDAGTPLVCDPGWKLARAVLDAGHRVFPVPGASALLAGLVSSGLASDCFMFCGFLPVKSGARKTRAAELTAIPATLLFYESGPRLCACLQDLARVFGPEREAVVARELTKLFEETRRDTLAALAAYYARNGAPKGEIVLLVARPPAATCNMEELDNALREAMKTQALKTAVDTLACQFAVPRRTIYQRALALKNE